MNLIACVDLEATCCDDNAFPRSESEIIEFGCTVIDLDAGTVVAEINHMVRPVVHTTLTEFCIQLTTIQQQDVDGADPWPVVAAKIQVELDALGCTKWASWGEYDLNQIRRESNRLGIKNPMSGRHHTNVKDVDCLAHKLKRPRGLKAAVESLGDEFEGTLHRGCDDARALAKYVTTTKLLA